MTREILRNGDPAFGARGPASLGPLAAFVGNWNGMGFNTISARSI